MINRILKIFGYQIVRLMQDDEKKEEEKKDSEKPKDCTMSNIEYNKHLWDNYAKDWATDRILIENSEIVEDKKESYIERLGDEWGTKDDVNNIIEEYIFPYINKGSIAGEIGVGGGRIASKVVGKVNHLYCFDVSAEMIEKAKSALQGTNFSNYTCILLDRCTLPESFTEKFDFIYSFDVFVHLDLHNMWSYFKEINRVLKCKGKAFLHTSNLGAPGGWDRFSKQDAYSVEGHYYISPEIIYILSKRSNFRIIKKSDISQENLYLHRDYLFILEK